MITSLTDLRMSAYIDLVCGKLNVLIAHNETVSPRILAQTRWQLMYDFSRLSDESGVKIALNTRKDALTVKAELSLFRICNNLIKLEEFAEVRRVLAQYGVDESRMTDEQIKREVERLFRRSETEQKRQAADGSEDDSTQSPAEIRSHFDRQAAMLMTYFKFQIDMDVVTASQFACMIDQANRETKAKLAAIGKH